MVSVTPTPSPHGNISYGYAADDLTIGLSTFVSSSNPNGHLPAYTALNKVIFESIFNVILYNQITIKAILSDHILL